MTSNGSAKRTSEETDCQNARHGRQKEEERVDSGNQDELHDRHQPTLFVKALHRQEYVKRDDAKEKQRNSFTRRNLGQCRRADQRDEGKGVNAERKHEMIDK